MNRTKFVIALLPALAIALAPGLAAARAGDSSSMGSRGAMTSAPTPATKTAPLGAAPVQRSMTQPSPAAPAPGMAPGGAPARSGFGSGLMGGLMGGLIGVGIGGMLMGHGFFSGGMGFMGFLGLILQVFLVVMVVRWVFRRFMGSGSPVTAQGPAQGMNMFTAQGAAPPPMGNGGGAPSGPPPVAILPQDYQQFEQLLQGIQAAWSAQDLNGLRAMVTPEMLSYFNEQLSEQASRGVRNIVGEVKLQSGDLAQSWAERGVEYATVAMRFSMTDVTMDRANRVVDGSATEHVTATEIWTFMRARGGHWVLSAIQQAR